MRSPKSKKPKSPTEANDRLERQDPLSRVRMDLPLDAERCQIDAEIASLVAALNDTGWIVTVGSCSGIHDGARGATYVHFAVKSGDVLRLAGLLQRLQGEDISRPFIECSLVYYEDVAWSCDTALYPDVVFFDVSMDLDGLARDEACRFLEELAGLVAAPT